MGRRAADARHEDLYRATATSRRTPSDEQLIAEGIEGQVPYRGPVGSVVYQLGGLRQSMFTPARARSTAAAKGRFVRITAAGLKSRTPRHQMVVEAPNYRRRR